MNTIESWIKSVDSNNTAIITLENKYRVNATVSTADVFDDKTVQKLDYRINFSVDNENVKDEADNIISKSPSDTMNSLQLLDHEYFLIQYISKHIQQYNIRTNNIDMYIKYLTWISEASLILSNRLKLSKINKEFTGDLIKRTYDFCPHRSNCQINYGKKKGKCCAPHYVHNIVHNDILMMIKYFEKNRNNSVFAFDQELFKVLKQINTIQFVINQMYIELSTFKNTLLNNNNDIEKFHHNCKIEEIKPINARNFRFSNMANLLVDDDDDDSTNIVEPKTEPTRSNMNVYRVWKE
jgi:hypothetical protein